MKRLIAGITIVELLIVLSVTGILVATAAPSINSMMTRSKTTAAVNRLVGAVNLTRQSAVQYQTLTTLCGVKTNGKCGAPWAEVLTVFLDRNKNAWLEEEDVIIKQVQPLNTDTTVRWRAFQNKQYLQMTPMGYTNYQNGNFVICPSGGSQKDARQVVINIQGRIRHNHRINESGFPVDRRGRKLRC